jgi:arginase family enzyme
MDGAEGVYVAVDFDALDADEVAPFMPEPGGLSVAELEDVLGFARERSPILGVGFSAFLPDERNAAALSRLARAAGF